MTTAGVHKAGRKKLLGQYFTDHKVGRLLAALADASSAKSIIDPMLGSGNLLQSCLSIGANPERLVGVELDPIALDEAQLALKGVGNAELILGDAFAVTLPSLQFDLVITNPPYIRYQSAATVDGISVPTGAEARAGLINAVNARSGFSDEERALWLAAAHEYPGTADIAVPAWILSAALVKEGGVLAVVAPQAWLSRNYAQAVRSLIDKAFDVETIVEDGDASWFPDAQVRTQLVVARRRSLASRDTARETVVARADRSLAVDNTLGGSLGSELAVARALCEVSDRRSVPVTSGLVAHVEHGSLLLNSSQTLRVPSKIALALGVAVDEIPVWSLDSYGWKAGQGLRSGANDFFYVSAVDGVIRPAERWQIDELPFPADCLVPSVRRQSDLGDGFSVDPSQLCSRVLALQGWVTKRDSELMGFCSARVLPSSVGSWIARVAESPLSQRDPTKLIPNLSAVRTNGKKDIAGRPVKFWYQLPEFSPRHRPAIFLGRVCGGRPKAYLNGAGVVVDANFSGLWPAVTDALPPEAVLALFNSSWVWANLELSCTVLGGGALKVEATDLRRVPLPVLSESAIQKLVVLGAELLSSPSEETRDSIDEAVLACLDIPLATKERIFILRALAERSLQQRTRPNGFPEATQRP